jgi:23S rRNA (uracil1939-C5)-methyltransferase
MAALTVTIDHLGGLGDGVADTPAGRLHVPFTAPGDVAVVVPRGKDQAELVEILTPGPARVQPPCRHFGRCGGCALQHLDTAFVADWKRERVTAALGRVGIVAGAVAPTISIPPRTRRRATLAAKRIGRRVALGFAERASHRLVDVEECWVVRPELVAIIGPLRERLALMLRNDEAADIAVTLTNSGIDLLFIRQRSLDLSDREALASMAESLDLARIAWTPKPAGEAEPVSARRAPNLRMGARIVAMPSGGFLQPSEEGQAELVRLAADVLKGTDGPICDLFSGIGTFTIPASAFGPVAAYDGDRTAVSALQNARIGGVTAHCRDLFREPLTTTELAPFSAAILDPPRAGALAQTKMLAQSNVPLIVYVSCNPVSFARDAAILADGGYWLDKVTPVDQFLWSPHIELVGVFTRR